MPAPHTTPTSVHTAARSSKAVSTCNDTIHVWQCVYGRTRGGTKADGPRGVNGILHAPPRRPFSLGILSARAGLQRSSCCHRVCIRITLSFSPPRGNLFFLGSFGGVFEEFLSLSLGRLVWALPTSMGSFFLGELNLWVLTEGLLAVGAAEVAGGAAHRAPGGLLARRARLQAASGSSAEQSVGYQIENQDYRNWGVFFFFFKSRVMAFDILIVGIMLIGVSLCMAGEHMMLKM